MSRRQPLIVAVVGAVLIVLAVALVIVPESGKISTAHAGVSSAQAQYLTLETQLAQLQQAEANGPQTRAKLAKVQGEVPPLADLPGIIRLVNTVSDASGIQLMTISPGQPAASIGQPLVSVVTLTLNVTGDFWSIDQFLYRLENLSRLVVVPQVSLSRTTPPVGTLGVATLTASISADFFTTDMSSGPGSEPGSQAQAPGVAPAPLPSPSVSPSPTASPSPTTSPTP